MVQIPTDNFQDIKAYLMQPISRFSFSSRVHNCLQGFTHAAHLYAISEFNYGRILNFGKVSLEDLKKVLSETGYPLGSIVYKDPLNVVSYEFSQSHFLLDGYQYAVGIEQIESYLSPETVFFGSTLKNAPKSPTLPPKPLTKIEREWLASVMPKEAMGNENVKLLLNDRATFEKVRTAASEAVTSIIHEKSSLEDGP